jgi:putative oxidoreductase
MKLADKRWALLPLRLIIGFGFAAHGYAKLNRGPDKFANILQSIGIPHPHIMAWMITLLEFIGGIGVMVGAFVVPLTLPLAVVMTTALITVHFQYGFSSIRLKAMTASGAEFGPIGYEMNLLYIVGLLTLALSGPTRLSLDNWLKTRKHSGNDGAR